MFQEPGTWCPLLSFCFQNGLQPKINFQFKNKKDSRFHQGCETFGLLNQYFSIEEKYFFKLTALNI